MKELMVSAALVITVAVLGFIGLDQIQPPAGVRGVEAAPAGSERTVPGNFASSARLIEQPLHLVHSPDQRLAVNYDAARWYELEYIPQLTLENTRMPGCRLELESDGEPLAIAAISEARLALGDYRYGVSSHTPSAAEYPQRVEYTTSDKGAYLVFTLFAGSEIQTADAFSACQADAENVLASLHWMK